MKTPRHFPATAACSALLMLPFPAQAIVKTWDGQGALERWDSGINWVGNNAPNSNDDLLWNSNGVGGYETDNDFPAGTQFRSLTFTSVDHGAVNGWVHNGNRVHLTHGINYYGDNTTLGLPVRLTGDQTWTNGASSAILYMENDATLDINARTLNVEGTVWLQDARLTGSGVVNVLEAGRLNLDAPGNSFSGVINVDNALGVLNAATLTGGADVHLAPGAELGCWPTQSVTHTMDIHMESGPAQDETALLDCVPSSSSVLTIAGTVTCTGPNNDADVNGGTLALQALAGTGDFDVSLFNGAGLRTQGASGVSPITGGVIVRTGPLQMGRTAHPSFNGPLQVLGGSVAWQANSQFGTLGTLLMDSATADMAGRTDTVRNLSLSESTLNMNGGILLIRERLTVDMPTPALADRSFINGNLGLLTYPATLDITHADGTIVNALTLTGNISGSGTAGTRHLVKEGNGRMVWTGNGSLDTLEVTEGEIIYDGTAATMNVSLNGGDLEAGGQVRDITGFAAGGTLSLPDAGTLTARNLALVSNNTFADVRPGIVNHPKLIATGTVALGNAVFSPAYPSGVQALALQGVIGEETVFIQKNSAGAVSGNFVSTAGTALPEGALISIPARTWRLSYAGGDGNDVSLTLVSVTATGITRSYTPPNATTDQWSNAAVWTPSAAILPGDALTFGNAANFTPFNSLPAGTSIHGLTFSQPGHTVDGNVIALSASIDATYSTGTTVVRTPFVLNNAIHDFRARNSAVLQIGEPGIGLGSVNLNGKILAVYPQHANSVVNLGGGPGSGSPAIITGSGTVRKVGAGTAIFSRHATYTGYTTVESGKLRIESEGAALGASGPGNETEVFFNAVLELATLGNSPVTDKIILTGGLRVDALTGSASLSSELVLNSPARPIEVASGTLVLGSVISGSSFTKSGPGTLYISGNTHTFTGPLVSNGGPVRILSNANRWPGDVDILGGSLSLEGNENLTGELLISVGTLDVLNGPQLLSKLVLVDATVQTGANQVSAPLIEVAGSDDTVWTGALHVRTASSVLRVYDLPFAGDHFILNGALTGTAGAALEVDGGGRVRFNGNNTLASVSLRDGVSSFTGSSPGMAVSLSGGNLAGTGTVGTITSAANGGRVDPGLSAGILSSGNIAWNAVTTFAPELATGAPGTNYDQLNVNGTVNLGGATLLVIPSGSPTGAFTIIQNDSTDAITGTFAGLAENSIVSNLGKSFRISYIGGTGNDVTLTAIISGTGVTRVWDGGDVANVSWNDPDNWVGDIAPVAGDDLVFPAVAADKVNANNFAANTTFNSIRIESSGYNLSGTALTLNAGLIWDYASGLSTVNLAITLAQPQTFSVLQGAQGSLGGLASVTNAGLALTADVAAAGQLTLLGLNGTGGLTRNGAGRLTLGGNNYTGATVLNAGLTSTSVGNGFGSAATAIAVNAAATLQFDAVAGTFTRPLTLGGKLAFLNTTMIASGAITLNGAARQIEVTGVTPAINSIISGSGGLQKTGTGTLTIGGGVANTFTGGTTVAAGTLRLAKSINQVALPGPVTIGDGTGTDILLYATANQIGNGATVNLSGSGAQFQCSTFSDTISALRLTGGSVSGTGTLTVGETIQSFAAATTASVDVNLVPGVSPFSVIVEDGTAATDLQISGTWNGAGSLAVERDGPGTLVFASDGTAATLTLSDGLTQILRDWNGVAIALNGGSLGGTGPVGDVTTVAGKDGFILPGASTDILAVSTFTGDPNTVLTMEIGGLTPGTGYDVLNIRGVADPQLATLSLQLLPGFTLLPGQSFTIVTNDDSDPMPSEFRSMAEGETFTFAGATVAISYKGGDGNDVTITVLNINDTGTLRVWDGGGANNNWMTAANWDDDTAPVPGDSLLFPAGAAQLSNNNNFPAGTSFHRIGLAGGFTLNGNSSFLNAGLNRESGGAGNATVKLPIVLTDSQSFSNLTGGTLIFASPGLINNNGSLVTLATTAGCEIRIAAPLSGSGGLLVTGTGTSDLDVSPAMTGTVSIQTAAQLKLGDGINLGTAASLSISANGQLVMPGFTPSTVTQPVTLRGMIQSTHADHVLTGTITLPAATTGNLFCSSNSLSVTGRIQGAGILLTTGGGTVKLQGTLANTFTGGLQTGGGIQLHLGKTGGVLAVPGSVSKSASIASTGTEQIIWLAPHQVADAGSISNVALLNLAGFSDTIASLTMTGGSVTTGAGTLTLTGNLTTIATANAASISGNLALDGTGQRDWTIPNGTATPGLQCDALVTCPGGATVRKLGTGSATFTAANVIPDLSIQQGTVNWNGTAPGTFITMAGGTLAGTGMANQITSIAGGGLITPGTSPGTLHANNFNWNAATTLRMEINGTAPGTQYDVLAMEDESFTNGATLDLQFGYSPAPGQTFTIISNGNLGDTFAGLPEGAFFVRGGNYYRITYTGGTGGDVVITRLDPVAPEIVSYTRTPGTGPNTGSDVVDFELQGYAGQNYLLEVSDDLVTWTTLLTEPADAGGQIAFHFLEPQTLLRRFYQARLE